MLSDAYDGSDDDCLIVETDKETTELSGNAISNCSQKCSEGDPLLVKYKLFPPKSNLSPKIEPESQSSESQTLFGTQIQPGISSVESQKSIRTPDAKDNSVKNESNFQKILHTFSDGIDIEDDDCLIIETDNENNSKNSIGGRKSSQTCSEGDPLLAKYRLFPQKSKSSQKTESGRQYSESQTFYESQTQSRNVFGSQKSSTNLIKNILVNNQNSFQNILHTFSDGIEEDCLIIETDKGNTNKNSNGGSKSQIYSNGDPLLAKYRLFPPKSKPSQKVESGNQYSESQTFYESQSSSGNLTKGNLVKNESNFQNILHTFSDGIEEDCLIIETDKENTNKNSKAGTNSSQMCSNGDPLLAKYRLFPPKSKSSQKAESGSQYSESQTFYESQIQLRNEFVSEKSSSNLMKNILVNNQSSSQNILPTFSDGIEEDCIIIETDKENADKNNFGSTKSSQMCSDGDPLLAKYRLFPPKNKSSQKSESGSQYSESQTFFGTQTQPGSSFSDSQTFFGTQHQPGSSLAGSQTFFGTQPHPGSSFSDSQTFFGTQAQSESLFCESQTSSGDCTKNIVESQSSLSDARREEIMDSIETILLNLRDAEFCGREPCIEIPKYKDWKCCIFDEKLGLDPLKENETVLIKKSSPKFSAMEVLLSKIYQMLKAKQNCNKREIFYNDKVLFRSQDYLNGLINDICCLFRTSPWQLGIMTSSKGLIAGDLKFTTDETHVNCRANLVQSVPKDVSTIRNIETNASFVLIVEKDTVFQKLIEEKATTLLGPCIIITAKGFPDANTRILIKQLSLFRSTPILALVDCDVYGIEVMCIYKYGSLAMNYQSEYLAVPSIKWIGLYPTDLGIYLLSKNTLKLSEKDRRRIQALLKRVYVRSNDKLKLELQLMLDSGVKAEIEALYTNRSNYLTETYLRGKVDYEVALWRQQQQVSAHIKQEPNETFNDASNSVQTEYSMLM